MRVLKFILLGFLSIVALVLLIALFVKKEYVITRDVLVDRPVGQVYDYVRQLKNQDHYNKWVMTDPQMKKTFKGVDGTLGFRYDWDGNEEAGKGEQEITELVENEKVGISIHFIKPFEGDAKNTILTKYVSENQTQVVSEFYSEVAYPMNFMLLLVDIDDVMGNDLDVTLLNLKSQLERNL